jgi:acyl-CoA synthetase (AMP-forming)/AMP-acid ligase II
MRNDIAFLEASYAAMMLGAYAVPINWHFKGEEVAYVLADSGSRVLVGHTDLLAARRPHESARRRDAHRRAAAAGGHGRLSSRIAAAPPAARA